MSTAQFLQIEGLRCTYPGQETCSISTVNLSLGEGESILVLGPSGCGKSTLAQCIRGLIPQEMSAEVEGSIKLGEYNPVVDDVFRLAEQVFLIHQDPDAQVVSLVVEDDVAFALPGRNGGYRSCNSVVQGQILHGQSCGDLRHGGRLCSADCSYQR